VTNWIKFATSTSDKPEVWSIASILNIDPDAVVGKLLRIWAWFDEHTESGNAKGNAAGNAPSVTKSLLDRKVGVTGFCDACISAGWMSESENEISLPNFERHNGKTAKTRVLTAQRVANHKKGNAVGNAKGNAGSNAASVSDALPRIDKIRIENSHTHTAQNADLPMQLGVVYPSGDPRTSAFASVAIAWDRWCEFRLSHDGRPVDPIQAEAVLMDLARRGEAKAIADIDFSIRKGSKSILDSDHDFQKQRSSRSSVRRERARVEI